MIIEGHKKNTAWPGFPCPMIDSATPADFKTGLTVTDTAYYKDGAGAWTSLSITDTFAEIGSTGVYECDLTAAELNHDQVVIKLTASGAAATLIVFKLDSNSRADIVADTEDIQSRLPAALVDGRMDANAGAISGDATAADNLEADYDGTGYAKPNSTVGTCTANTDMRGTDSAALAADYTAARAAKLDNADAATSTRATPADVAAALATYDAPTKAEMDAGLAGLNDPTAAAIRSEVDANSTQLAAIKAKTDNLPTDPADQSLIIAATTAIVADTEDIQARLPAALDGGRMDSSVGAMQAGGLGDFFDTDSGKTYATAVAGSVVKETADNAGSASLIAGPVTSVTQASQQVEAPVRLEMFVEETRAFTVSVVDGNGDPIDLSAMTLRFVVHDSNKPTNAKFKIEGGGIVVSGDDDEIATITVTGTEASEIAEDWHWKLWNVASSRVLQHGPFVIKPAKKDSA
jgi:hypothetical protein